jgi:hypothetical protein
MSRPKLNMPLKEQNSPRSQWISNVSLLKNQLKDGELVEASKKQTPKISWNELEAQLGKRMRQTATATATATATTATKGALPNINTNVKSAGGDSDGGGGGGNPFSPTSATLNLIPHPHHSPDRNSNARAAPLPSGLPVSTAKRPVLSIPTSPKSHEVLKQVHNGTAQLPNRSTAGPVSSRMKAGRNGAGHVKVESNVAATRTGTPKVEADGARATHFHRKTGIESSWTTRSNAVAQESANEAKWMEKSMQVEIMKEIVNESKRRRYDTNQSSKDSSNKIINVTDDVPTPTVATKSHEDPTKSMRILPDSVKPYSGAASVVSEQPPHKGQSSAQNHPEHTVPRPAATKTKGSLSWLRRTLKPNSSKPSKRSVMVSDMTQVSLLTSDSNRTKTSKVRSTASSSSRESKKRAVEKYFQPTTPLQLGLWLSELQKAIRVAKQELTPPKDTTTATAALENNSKAMQVVDACPPSPGKRREEKRRMHKQQHHQQQQRTDGTVNTLEAEDVYYHKNRDVGVYVDYSTFDDGDSVSSVELLFRWLTCRELNDRAVHDGTVMTPPGTVIATESNVSDDLSIDFEARPTRRTFFSR